MWTDEIASMKPKWIFKMYNWNKPKSHKLDASYHGINLQKVNCLKFTAQKCVHIHEKRRRYSVHAGNNYTFRWSVKQTPGTFESKILFFVYLMARVL